MNQKTEEQLWAVLELMGHVKTGALISKDTQFGTALLRAEVPQTDGSFVTQLVNPSSIYRITICEESIARACAKECQSKPMSQWELKHLLPVPTPEIPMAATPDDDDDDHYNDHLDEF
jgi:hypothetical protein